MSTHGSLVKLLVSLGYTKTEGCCHGFSLRWLEACLLNEEDLFDARIQKIVSGGEALVHSIHAVKEKKGQNLNADDKELLDILAFYDSLELYQSPSAHSSLFNASVMQDGIEFISQVASSDTILSRGGLSRIYSEPGIYTKKEIKAYFDDLGLVIEKVCAQLKAPLGIILLSKQHTMALTYTPGKGWKFMDINQYPAKAIMINETDLLAKRIMRGFLQSNSPYCAFNVSIFTTGNHLGLLNLKKTFSPFKKSHLLTKKIARREAEGVGLAHIVAQQGHASVIATLAKHKVDLNKATSSGSTPAYIAAQKGHSSVIAELAKYGVDLNQAISNGLTPAYIAAQNGHSLVIAELAKHQVDLNQVIDNGSTPAFIAAQQGHASVIAELAKYQVDLNRAMSHGGTPAFIAAQNGHISVIIELIKAGVQFNTSYTASTDSLKQVALLYGNKVIENMNDFIDQQLALSPTSDTISMTPYQIAVVMGHREIMQLLRKQEEQDQNERLHVSLQLMERTQSGHDKIIGDGHTFFSSLVKEDEASSGVNPREYSDVNQYSGKKRKFGELGDDDLPEHDEKRICYFL